MLSQSTLIALAAALFASSAFAGVIPAEDVTPEHKPKPTPSRVKDEILPRATLASAPFPSATCFNTWETVTNDPVVQYWYMYVPNSAVKANDMWKHLNLLGCAPTEHKYYSIPSDKGVGLTFHTSEACTAWRVSEAYKDSSSPQITVPCVYTGKDKPDGEEGAAEGFEAFLEGAMALGED